LPVVSSLISDILTFLDKQDFYAFSASGSFKLFSVKSVALTCCNHLLHSCSLLSFLGLNKKKENFPTLVFDRYQWQMKLLLFRLKVQTPAMFNEHSEHWKRSKTKGLTYHNL